MALPSIDRPRPRRPDVGFVVAIAWLAVAAVVTIWLGPSLGLRGWAWLGLHHVLCLVGCTHEITRAYRRYRRAKPTSGD